MPEGAGQLGPETAFGKRQPAITKVVTVPDGAIYLLIHDQRKRQIYLKRISSEENLAQIYHPPWVVSEELRDRYYGNLNFFAGNSGAIYFSYGQSFGVSHPGQDRLLFSSSNNNDPTGWISLGCFLEDDHGGLWLSTDVGLVHYRPEEGDYRLYNESDGIPYP